MKASSLFSTVAFALLSALTIYAADLKQSKFTQVINDVKVLTMPAKVQKAAAVNDIFKIPDIVRTGPASRAELVADDKTITRVGANTIFSFDAANRTIDLEKGSLLFHSPKGKGGGQIKTGSATAAVLGTTIIVSTTPDGGFKLLVLEGTAKVTLPNGQTEVVKAGQEVFILPGGQLSPIIDFRLGTLIADSKLVGGFESPLPSMDQIHRAVDQQEQLIVNGEAQDTGFTVGSGATATTIEAIPTVDPNNYPPALQPPALSALTPSALGQDVNINSPRLDDHPGNLFLQPTAVSGPGLSGNFIGLFGRDLNFVTGSETIDLFPFESLSTFTFLASRDINIQHSIDFFGSSSASLSLVAAGSINIDPETTVSYSGPGFFLQSGNAMSYNAVSFQNFSGLMDLQTASTMSLNNCSVAGGNVNLTSGGNMQLQNTTLNASAIGNVARGPAHTAAAISLPTGTVNLKSVNGSVVVLNSSFFGQTLNGRAVKTLNFDTVNLSSFNAVNLAAHTLILKNINFADGSQVTLRSYYGLLAANPNTGASPVAGYVNFISNVNYGGKPAQNFIGSGITIAKLK